MGSSLHLLPAPAADASKHDLGEWLELIGIGTVLLARMHIEAACEERNEHARDVAAWLVDDLGTIVAALGKFIAGGKLELGEEEYGPDAFNRITDAARALGRPLTDGTSHYFDFAVEAVSERLVREIRNVEQAAEARA